MEKNKSLTPRQKMETLKDLLGKMRENINAVVPQHLTPDKIIKVALSAMSRNPKLLECSSPSILKSVMMSTQLGLELDDIRGYAYLVPYKNKQGFLEAQFIPGYRGLAELAKRGGDVYDIDAQAVYEKDEFHYEKGLNPILKHVPEMNAPGELIAAYAIARFEKGFSKFEVMTRKQIDKIRKRSKAANNGPWVTDFDEMARKTAVKKLCKYLRLSPELSMAVALDSRAEIGQTQSGIIQFPGYDPDTPEVVEPEKPQQPKRKSETQEAPPLQEEPEQQPEDDIPEF